MLDVTLDRRDALVERTADRVPEPLPRKPGEEPLDGVHPRGRGRREVKRPVGVVPQPFVDLGRPVGGDVVGDDMNLGPGPNPLGDGVGERGEFLRAVTFDHLAGDLSGGAVAPVVMGAGPGMAGLHRQGCLRPSQRLDPVRALTRTNGVHALTPVHRDDHGVVGRIDVEADDLADLQPEPRVAGDPECPDPVGPEAMTL